MAPDVAFDRKAFGRGFRDAILKAHGTQEEATRRLRLAGLENVTPQRVSEYCLGKKVPTLERLCQMVAILGLDPGLIFPEWTRYRPSKAKKKWDGIGTCPRCEGPLKFIEGGGTQCQSCQETFPF